MGEIWVAEGRRGGRVFIEMRDDLFKILTFGAGLENSFPIGTLKARLDALDCHEPVRSKMDSGEYHPRIWRGGMGPSPQRLDQIRPQWVSTVRTTRMLYSKLTPLFAAIEPDRVQDNTYGLLQREILILACTEVESAWKSVLAANNAAPKGKYWNTKDYVRLLPVLRLSEWRLSLSSHHMYRWITPFASWDAAKPTESLPWYDAYNAVKHGREDALERATFGHAVDAVGAAFVMTSLSSATHTLRQCKQTSR